MPRPPLDARTTPAAVIALLVTTGWAANHFAAVIPALHEREGLSQTLLAGVYGLYAAGLLPGLLTGGGLSDRVGRAAVAVPGAVLALAGTVALAVWHEPVGLVVGRIVVGLGAGAVFSAGTAWLADLRGPRGAVVAGIGLTSGFATGPLVSGLLAELAPAPLVLPFVLSAVLSAGAVAACLVRRGAPREVRAAVAGAPRAGEEPQVTSTRRALVRALPIAPLVFATGTIGVVTLPGRLPGDLEGPALAGTSAFVVLGTGLLAQLVVRRRGGTAGLLGALSGAVGVGIAALLGAEASLGPVLVAAVLLGICYGLCLHAGLVEIDRWAPAASRGGLIGLFYVATYVGFGAPVALEALEGPFGASLPLWVLAGLAVAAGLARVLTTAPGGSRTA